MKRNILLVVLCILIAFVSVSCASSSSSSSDSWILNPYDRKYPESEYLMAVGSGTGRNPAIDNAMQNLAIAFNVDVYSSNTSTAYGSAQVSNGQRNVNSFVENQNVVSTVSDVKDIVGVEVYDVVEKDGRVYARVGLNRSNSINLLNERISSMSSYLNSEISKASRANNVNALAICSAIYEDALTADSYLLQKEILTGQSEIRFVNRIVAIRNSIVSGKSAKVTISMPYTYDSSTVRGIIEAALRSAGITVVQYGADYEVLCDIGVYSDKYNASNYVIDNVAVTLSLSDGSGNNSVSSMEKITSLSQPMALQNVMKYLNEEIRDLLRELLSV